MIGADKSIIADLKKLAMDFREVVIKLDKTWGQPTQEIWDEYVRLDSRLRFKTEGELYSEEKSMETYLECEFGQDSPLGRLCELRYCKGSGLYGMCWKDDCPIVVLDKRIT